MTLSVRARLDSEVAGRLALWSAAAVIVLGIYRSIPKFFELEGAVFAFSALVAAVHWSRALMEPEHVLKHGRVAFSLLSLWLLALFVSGVLRGEPRVAVTGLATLVLYPLLWLAVLRHGSRIPTLFIIKVLVWASVIMAGFGIYQYHFDKVLWVSPHSLYSDEYMLQTNLQVSPRATSFIGSPQNLAFLIVVAMPFVELAVLTVRARVIAAILLLYGGILTGSGFFGAGVLAFGVYRLIALGTARGLSAVAAVLAAFLSCYVAVVIVLFGWTAGEHPIRGAVSLGLEDHLPYYMEQVGGATANPVTFLLGHGLGHADRLVELFAPVDWVAFNESHVLRVLYEIGFVGTLLLGWVLLVAFRESLKVRGTGIGAPVTVALLMVVLNAFFAPVLSGFTGSIVSGLVLALPLIGITSADLLPARRVAASPARPRLVRSQALRTS